jgi:hypothetical protein
VRDALADAALRILAEGRPGAAEVRSGVAECFPGRPAVADTVVRKARAGKIRTKLLALK